jgi:hypothetical protein
MSAFQHAQKSRAKVRIGMIGPSGSGKTYSALAVGCKLAALSGGRVAVIDTERGSASLYADRFDFDVVELDNFSPRNYMQAIADAQKAGYVVLVIDSLSHAWSGKGGALEMVDKAAMKSQSSNTFAAWRTVTPLHNQLVDTILQANCHVIATLRAKTEWVIDDVNGKKVPRKIGLAPIMRDGIEYEFTVCGDLTAEHLFMVSKSRCEALADAMIEKPGEALAGQLFEWINAGAVKPARVVDTPQAQIPAASKPNDIPYDLETHADALKTFCVSVAESAGFGEGSQQRAELRTRMTATWRKMCVDSGVATSPNSQTDEEFESVFQKFRWFYNEVQKGVTANV